MYTVGANEFTLCFLVLRNSLLLFTLIILMQYRVTVSGGILEALCDVFHYQWKPYTIKPRLQEGRRGERERKEEGERWKRERKKDRGGERGRGRERE